MNSHTASDAAVFGEGVSELTSRSADGVDVALLWRPCDDAAIVVVVDHHNGDSFLLDVTENDNALDVFYHPYAYAARRVENRWTTHGEKVREAA